MRALRFTVVVVLLAAALAGVLLWTAPADLAYRLFQDRLGALRLGALTGSVWDGKAGRATAFGTPLGALSWRVERAAALGGRARGTLELAGDAVRGRAAFDHAAPSLILRDVDLVLPAHLLGPALDIPALRLLGTVTLRAPYVRVDDGLLKLARGRAEWRELGVSGAAEARLPGLAIDFGTRDDDTIVADIRDLGGPLAIDGQVTIRGGAFDLRCELELREPNPPLEEALKFIGERTPEGGSLLLVTGEIERLW
jgi:general secretion pathway protein N